MPRKHLSLQQRVEAARVLDTIDHLRSERGAKNESFAQEICKGFVEQGLIECFWTIQKNSRLDRKGIDIVVKASKGYYFLNVKSSLTGVESFRQHGLRLDGENIYPWRVVCQNGHGEAERSLENILRSVPSCDELTVEVQKEMEGLTPNVLRSDSCALTAGKHEQRLLDEERRRQKARAAWIKLEKRKSALQEILFSGCLSWPAKFEELRAQKICFIKKWSAVERRVIQNGLDVAEWVGEIKIKVLDDFIVRGQAVSNTEKGAKTLAAEMAAKEIRKML